VPAGYTLTITTAFAKDPFPNQINHPYTVETTGYFQVALAGDATFSGVIGTIAVPGYTWVIDMSYRSDPLVLGRGESVSIAIPNNSSAVGGFNGPIFEYRPGIEIYLDGWLTDGTNVQAFNLLVADRDIHSESEERMEKFGLLTNSFVLQGGDPWGFQTSSDFALSQGYGVYVVTGTVPEPGSLTVLTGALITLASTCGLSRRRLRPRRA
jgi:hypothetical protein